MADHTPEPWEFHRLKLQYPRTGGLVDIDNASDDVAVTLGEGALRIRRAERIQACVNACAGIANPSAVAELADVARELATEMRYSAERTALTDPMVIETALGLWANQLAAALVKLEAS